MILKKAYYRAKKIMSIIDSGLNIEKEISAEIELMNK